MKYCNLLGRPLPPIRNYVIYGQPLTVVFQSLWWQWSFYCEILTLHLTVSVFLFVCLYLCLYLFVCLLWNDQWWHSAQKRRAQPDWKCVFVCLIVCFSSSSEIMMLYSEKESSIWLKVCLCVCICIFCLFVVKLWHSTKKRRAQPDWKCVCVFVAVCLFFVVQWWYSSQKRRALPDWKCVSLCVFFVCAMMMLFSEKESSTWLKVFARETSWESSSTGASLLST